MRTIKFTFMIALIFIGFRANAMPAEPIGAAGSAAGLSACASEIAPR